MLKQMVDFEKFRPDSTGKYSPLLFKWLNHKHQRAFGRNKVFQCYNRIDGNGFYERLRSIEIIIGSPYHHDDGRIAGVAGRCLRDIICGSYRVNTQSFYYGASFGLRDITSDFFEKYEKHGRCVWDENHSMYMIADESRWHYIRGGTQRECNWCGHVQESINGRWETYQPKKQSILLHPMGSMGEEC